MSTTPAEIGGDAARGALRPGDLSDLVLVDPAAHRVLAASDLVGRSTNSPYLGRDLPGRVVATLFRGTPTVLDGAVVDLEPAEVDA
jgi:dihydroorotase